MPIYNFKNVSSGEVIEKMCSIAMRDEMVASGEWIMHHQRAADIGDSIRMGLKKSDSTFRDMLKEMKKTHSKGFTKSSINDT